MFWQKLNILNFIIYLEKNKKKMAIKNYFVLKGIVHPKMKITQWFTHPQAILGVYDILFSDKYNRS